MPAALDVDWTGVQMLALTVGVREAARQLGISEDAVRMRSSREGWIADRPASVPLPPTMLKSVTVVTTPLDAYKKALNERGNKSRLNAAVGLGAAADKIAEMDGMAILSNSQDVKNVVSSLSTVHAWAESAPSIRLNLSVTGASDAVPDISTQEAEIIESGELP